ncbi:SDR family NAD(P)-dependent oxidoreductase [Pseudolysinimonas sp.]|jgi:NAD(P)-dependent dehydrogenase (short-subunit alcohol dehydrogenase family)|uniref:SDR family NAD(P)-dependent oxidoreductase n=1 Tax=Pseudolysinimonas sp. TaxID=2680009 RepID=UPI00378440BB
MTGLNALVTGAANGIGAAVAAALRDRGDRVVGIDREPGDGILVADLADPAARAAAVAEALGALGSIDVLVAVAGVYREGSIHDSGFDDWRPVWAVNLDAPLDLMRLVTAGMRERGFGRIVTITSVHARQAQAASLAYDVSKAGLEAATRSAALDLARYGVLANAVAPGFVRTRMSLLPDGRDETDTDEFRATYVEGGKLPLGRAATPAEVAHAVAFLAARENTYITGQVLTVDGGLTMTF